MIGYKKTEDSTTCTTSGQTDTTSRQKRITNGETNGQTFTTSGKRVLRVNVLKHQRRRVSLLE